MIEYNETWRQFLIIVLSQILKGQVQAKQQPTRSLSLHVVCLSEYLIT